MGMSISNKSTLRVCIVSPFYPSDKYPGAFTEYYLAKYMQISIMYITRAQPGANLWPPPQNVFLKQINYPEIQLGKGPFSYIRLICKALSYLMFFLCSIPSLIRWKPMIIHIVSPMPIFHALFAKYLLRSKFCVTLIGSDILRLEKIPLFWYLLKLADRVFCVNPHILYSVMRNVSSRKVVFLPRGVEVGEFINNGTKRERLILSIGGLRWQKGFKYLISAMKLVLMNYPDYRLLIVGEGEDYQNVIDQIKKSGLEKNVEIIGTQQRPVIAALLNKSKLLVLASVSEGFPKVLLEAAACKTPVVATNVGACHVVEQEGFGLIVPPKNHVELAKAICKIIENEELWKTFSEAGPLAARKYDWKTIAFRLQEAYYEII